MKDGLVSIITPLYNSGAYIASTIESVLAQTYTDWEMLITDDCSSDDGPAIVERYAAKVSRIRLIRLERNGCPGAARNNSIKEARGRYIAMLDSDDRWLPDKLEKQMDFMKTNGYGIVYSSYYLCSESGDNINGIIKSPSRIGYRRILIDDSIGFLTMVYDRTVTGDVLMPEQKKRQDWGLKILLMQSCPYAYGMKEPLAIYRKRKGSVSRNKFSLIKYNRSIYMNVLGYSGFRATLIMIFCFLPFNIAKKIAQFAGNIFFTPPSE